jgi:hypothetical protein
LIYVQQIYGPWTLTFHENVSFLDTFLINLLDIEMKLGTIELQIKFGFLRYRSILHRFNLDLEFSWKFQFSGYWNEIIYNDEFTYQV